MVSWMRPSSTPKSEGDGREGRQVGVGGDRGEGHQRAEHHEQQYVGGARAPAGGFGLAEIGHGEILFLGRPKRQAPTAGHGDGAISKPNARRYLPTRACRCAG